MRTLKKPNREGLLDSETMSGPKAEESKRETLNTNPGKTGGKHLTKEKASRLINRYSLAAAAAGMVPLPGTDVVVVSAIQADMVEELAHEYGLKLSPGWIKKALVMLVGSMTLAVGARMTFSALKAVPVFGSVLGGGTSAIASAVTTYAIGRAVAEHFGNGGTLDEAMIPELAKNAAKHAVFFRGS